MERLLCLFRRGLSSGGLWLLAVLFLVGTTAAQDSCRFFSLFNPDVFPEGQVLAVWDMEKEDWCLCSSPNLPYPPYNWCPSDIAGTIVAALSTTSPFNYVLICNCMDWEGNPVMPPHVYYWGTVPLLQLVAVACDDRGPEVYDKSFWWGDSPSELLLHTDLWGNVLHGPFTPSDLGVPSFPVTGLTKDEENHHLWAICRDMQAQADFFYEFDIANPAMPRLIQGPLPVPWPGGGMIMSAAGGLEHNTANHRLIGIDAQNRLAVCFRDNDPSYPGWFPPWPGVSLVNYCLLGETVRPFGVAVKDGRGPQQLGVLEVIDQTTLNTFPVLAYRPPCPFGLCPDPDSLVIKAEMVELPHAVVLMWPPVPGVSQYNVYQAYEPFPDEWLLIASVPDTSYAYFLPDVPKSFFHVRSDCTPVGFSTPMENLHCRHPQR